MGGANYVRHLAAALGAAAPQIRVSFICGEAIAADWLDAQPRIVIPTRRSLFRGVFRRKPLIRQALERAHVDFVYPLTYDNEYNLGLRFPISAELGAAPWAGWIPDFQHRYLPELFPPEEIHRRETRITQLVKEARRVVLSSRNAADDFRVFFPEHAGKAKVLSFTTPPFDLHDVDMDELGDLPERFFLVCNQFWKHKNHLVVFDALRLLRARGLTPTVLCTGEMDDYRDRAYAGKLRAALVQDGVNEQVRLLGLIPRRQQIALMRRAVAIIQPSLFEGWSSVVEDALSLGRPCLLSDLAVHREQQPPGARFFPPRSAEALADLLAEAFSDWPPGPNLASEAAAQERALARLTEVGNQFLKIATTCCA
jgi:glycosyltransferase involved in cell wall biosynthesis